MSLAVGFLVCLSIVASGYISNADVEEDKKTVCNAVIIIIWVIAFVGSIVFK